MAVFKTQAEINNVIWQACDTFRGVIDPSQYKDYILVMLFVKYLSDLFKDKLAEYQDKYQGDEKRIERTMSRERFYLPPNARFDYLYEHRNAPNIGELIDEALAQIEHSNKEKLQDVFRNISFNNESTLGETKERNDRLKHLLEDFAQLDLRPSHLEARDVIGDCYEYLIGKFAADSGKKGGEFYTPPEVSTLLARIIAPKSGDTICDPCCGSGSLLIRTAQEIKDRNTALYGQEMNGGTWALCRMNMFLHGFDNATIAKGDTIRNPQLLKDDQLQRFNVVVANPPFSLDKWGHENAQGDRFGRFSAGVPPKSRGDYAFIQHMVTTMAQTDGRVGVVVPHGVLFRGASEGKIRKALIEQNLLEGVIGLPANLFFGTGIPAALVFFNRSKSDDKVFFIDASNDYEDGKNQNRLRQEDIEKIVSTWQKRENVEKYAYLASLAEVKENDFNLNIPLYVDTFEEEEEIDIKGVQEEIKAIEGELLEVRGKMDAYLQELGLI
ncbi:type I restriction-modification system subunit M [Cyanobacterium aponinum]|uniref:site-specific DNA-methyltransferase (adenine-specific) n=1 Tax=Cyanobacterium aponinum 0216 TaxID=2676140 RepID=A0A844H2C5_9CHRO|nr:type I restriction-modification system subunit M [Cyanobacterium aponinum]MTF40306.1 type I restriction-modification system subunit M [Cyanobacterium aponinum 0216]